MSNRAKTIDGERLRVDELNLGAGALEDTNSGGKSRLQRWYRNLSLVLAGMYTGLNCYGTPKTEHEYDDKGEKPDRRLI